jgi:hypothetical protein
MEVAPTSRVSRIGAERAPLFSLMFRLLSLSI